MRFEGTITNWNDERGFGRIESTQGGEPIFMHVSSWPPGAGRPRLNQVVSFEVEVGPKGKRARDVQPLAVRRSVAPKAREGSAPWGPAALIALPAFLALCGVIAVLWKPPVWLAGGYLGLSLLTFLAYALDKSAAVRGGWRTPEKTLHLLALAGGWPGALLAQQLLRHKSSKQPFRTVFWATVVLNVGGLVVLASPWGRVWLRGGA